MKIQLPELTHSQYAIHTLDWLFGRPIFKSSDFIRSAQIPKPTATRILGILKENNILDTAFFSLADFVQGSYVFTRMNININQL